MVPPAPHPRFQLTVSTTSNQSLLCAVSVSQETGFCVRRQRARKHTVVVRPSLWRPKRGNEARHTWAMRESPGNLLKRRSAWWWMKSPTNWSPRLNSLIYGNLQGIFCSLQGIRPLDASKTRARLGNYNEIPYATEQGILFAAIGKLQRDQGTGASEDLKRLSICMRRLSTCMRPVR